MQKLFNDLVVIELASVLAGPSVGQFFQELGATVIKVENPKTGGDITRSWKTPMEDPSEDTSAYYWCVNSGKEIVYLDLTVPEDLTEFYTLIKTADILISNYKMGDDLKLKVDFDSLYKINSNLIYASINGFGSNNPRTAYDLILQAESGFMYMNGEEKSTPLKMPVAIIDLLAGHQLKEAILIALIKKFKTNVGSHITVSLFDSAIASLANQATNWLIANHLPHAQGSLHPNIAPYGEIFITKDNCQITFAIGNDKQFKLLCLLLKSDIYLVEDYETNVARLKNRHALYNQLKYKIEKLDFDFIFEECQLKNIPIGKIRNLKEVFEMPEAKELLKTFNHNGKILHAVKSAIFKFK